jgi:hypothetical protein
LSDGETQKQEDEEGGIGGVVEGTRLLLLYNGVSVVCRVE